ncbi:hypothetical protein QFZ33_003041 [Arthrobacter globiformis]|nr:hypothetical protein [Arthrobacter globiformis]
MEWQSDILGPGFESCAFEAAGGDGVRRRATLVRFASLHRTPRTSVAPDRAGQCSSCMAGATTSST